MNYVTDLLEYYILLSYPEWLDSFSGGLVDKFDQYPTATDKPVNCFPTKLKCGNIHNYEYKLLFQT